MSAWRTLTCKSGPIQLYPVLLGGQSFRWSCKDGNTFIGVFNNAVWHLRESNDNSILYKTFTDADIHNKDNSQLKEKALEDELKYYLRLDENLEALYSLWSERDPYFKEAAVKFYGLRILRQDVFENIFSFICSSNNNISRISSMVGKLCSMYGSLITSVDGDAYYSFPQIQELSGKDVEKQLREAGFGYRAKFIYQSACKIVEAGQYIWLRKLQKMTYPEAKVELMKLPGIGAKVADCICLMSLNHLCAVPVDTHVFQIASKRYLPHLKEKKTVTDKVYNEISDHFRSVFGDYAGWAHTVLFCADLKSFQKKGARKRKSSSRD